MTLPDFVPSGNQNVDPDLYEIENRAFDRRRLVLDAMHELASWEGRRLVDLGCGSGFWLPIYQATASSVIGIEPDPNLVSLARARHPEVEVRLGSAEHIPLEDGSVDVVHARFAYFFGAGAEAGLAEVRRILTPHGRLVVVDNDEDTGDFAGLLADAYPRRDPERWWSEQGAERRRVLSDWTFDNPEDLAAVLRLEFPAAVANRWVAEHPGATSLSYGYQLFAVGTNRVAR